MWNADLTGGVLLKEFTGCIQIVAISRVQGLLLFMSAHELDINTAVQKSY